MTMLFPERSEITKVRTFMEKFDQPVRYRPVDSIPVKEKLLRLMLIAEELDELARSMHVQMSPISFVAQDTEKVDPVEALDALTDILYVTFGAYHTLGLGKGSLMAFNEVHESNMSKLVEGALLKNQAGKVLKGPNYFPPDIKSIVHEISKPTTFVDPQD